MTNITYKPDSNIRYVELSAVKRRRIDASEAEMARFSYLVHPFSEKNPMRLIDDIFLDKVLSLQSLVSDIDNGVDKEKVNAVERLKIIKPSEFIDYDE